MSVCEHCGHSDPNEDLKEQIDFLIKENERLRSAMEIPDTRKLAQAQVAENAAKYAFEIAAADLCLTNTWIEDRMEQWRKQNRYNFYLQYGASVPFLPGWEFQALLADIGDHQLVMFTRKKPL